MVRRIGCDWRANAQPRLSVLERKDPCLRIPAVDADTGYVGQERREWDQQTLPVRLSNVGDRDGYAIQPRTPDPDG